jgi:hypothetical protein
MALATILAARDAYMRALIPLGEAYIVERHLSDRETELTGRAFTAKDDSRVLQISIDDDAVPTAFIKSVGFKDDRTLLQIIVKGRNLHLNRCKHIFKMWLVDKVSEDEMDAYISEF